MDIHPHTKMIFSKEFGIVAIIAAVVVLGGSYAASNSVKLSFIDSNASAPCESYTSSGSCTGSKACEWYGNACHIPSCGGLLNVSGKNDTSKYTGGCFPGGVLSNQGWVYAGLTNDCGAVAGNITKGCFYKPLQATSSNANTQVSVMLDSCGGTLNRLGKANPAQFIAGCFPSGAPNGSGWIYAGQTNDCGSVANNTTRGCFYKQIAGPPPTPSSSPSPTRTPTPTPNGSGTIQQAYAPGKLGSSCDSKNTSFCGQYSCVKYPYDIGSMRGVYACGGVFPQDSGSCNKDNQLYRNGPDLDARDITYPSNLTSLKKGGTAVFKGSVNFVGVVRGVTNNYSITVAWYLDGKEVFRERVRLPSGPFQNTIISSYTATLDGKNHIVKMIADPDNEIAESQGFCTNGKTSDIGETDNTAQTGWVQFGTL